MNFSKTLFPVVMMAVLAVGGCKTSSGPNGSSGMLDNTTDEIVAAGLVGCYTVSSAIITADRNNPINDLKTAKKFCAVDSRRNGGASRSGTFVFNFYDSSGAELGSAYGFSASDSQPRCPRCYALEGMDGRVSWSNTQETNPVDMSITWSQMGASGKFKMTKQSGGSTAAGKSIDGVYERKRFTVTVAADHQTAELKWANGASEPTFRYNANPNPGVRCPCWVFEADGGQRLIVEHDFSNNLKQVTYERNQVGGSGAGLSADGVYQGIKFNVV